MPRPFTAALTTIAAGLLLASINCGVDSSPRGTATVTSSATTLTQPSVTFTTSSSETVRLAVEIADAPWSRSRGLMLRDSLSDDAGMLFVWPEDTSSGFWMRDTLIPLSIAFIDATGIILDIQDMQPLDETLHTSPGPFRYAAEANQGWFAAHGIAAGDSAVVPASVSPVGG